MVKIHFYLLKAAKGRTPIMSLKTDTYAQIHYLSLVVN